MSRASARPSTRRNRISDSPDPRRAIGGIERELLSIEVRAEQLLRLRHGRPIVIRRAPAFSARDRASYVEQREEAAVANASDPRALRAREIHGVIDSNVVHRPASH